MSQANLKSSSSYMLVSSPSRTTRGLTNFGKTALVLGLGTSLIHPLIINTSLHTYPHTHTSTHPGLYVCINMLMISSNPKANEIESDGMDIFVRTVWMTPAPDESLITECVGMWMDERERGESSKFEESDRASQSKGARHPPSVSLVTDWVCQTPDTRSIVADHELAGWRSAGLWDG